MSKNGMKCPCCKTADSEHRDVRGAHKKGGQEAPGYTRALFRRKDRINNVNHTIRAFNIRLNDYGIVHC